MKYENLLLIIFFPRLVLLQVKKDRGILKKIESYQIPNYLVKYPRGPSAGTTAKQFVFEGVDYDLIPKKNPAYRDNHDCHHHFLDCIRDFTLMTPVCVWNWDTYYFENFYSICEVVLKNCLWRLKEKIPFRGNSMQDDNWYFNGEDFNCVAYARRGNMLEAYFGTEGTGFDFKEYGITYYKYENNTYYI